jgi:hypothetical protein
VNIYELQPRFAALFDGLKIAHGTGKGEWVHRPLRAEDWVKHLQGHGPGIGVAPLREDNTVMFAAIDLDEPDFEAAREMQKYIPGDSWVERSRSGNAHVWVFFDKACPAWLAMAVLKEATLAAGKKGVEVFPKNHDFERVRLGNYINLPYHGDQRPVLNGTEGDFALEDFLERVEKYGRNDPEKWSVRAELMQISPPSARAERSSFGDRRHLHPCAGRIIDGEAGPIVEGTRNAVFFMLAKCLMNWERYESADEVVQTLLEVNRDLCDPPEKESEIRRIVRNVAQGQYTSTGCDDPLVEQYADPECPIAHPKR